MANINKVKVAGITYDIAGISPEQAQQIETNKTDIISLKTDKQDKLIAGEGISIAEDGKTISAAGGGGSKLYRHIITFATSGNGPRFSIQIINTDITPFTYKTLVEKIKAIGCYSDNADSLDPQNLYPASGTLGPYPGKIVCGVWINIYNNPNLITVRAKSDKSLTNENVYENNFKIDLVTKL